MRAKDSGKTRDFARGEDGGKGNVSKEKKEAKGGVVPLERKDVKPEEKGWRDRGRPTGTQEGQREKKRWTRGGNGMWAKDSVKTKDFARGEDGGKGNVSKEKREAKGDVALQEHEDAKPEEKGWRGRPTGTQDGRREKKRWTRGGNVMRAKDSGKSRDFARGEYGGKGIVSKEKKEANGGFVPQERADVESEEKGWRGRLTGTQEGRREKMHWTRGRNGMLAKDSGKSRDFARGEDGGKGIVSRETKEAKGGVDANAEPEEKGWRGRPTGIQEGRMEKHWTRGGNGMLAKDSGKPGDFAEGEDGGKGNVSKKEKKAKGNERVTNLRDKLDMCSKRGDVMGAISLYDSAVKEGIRLGQHPYNVLLYLCSSAALGFVQPAKSGSASRGIPSIGPARRIYLGDELIEYARTRGFEIFERMCSEKERVKMSEAALTAKARMAMSMGNSDMAFDIVKQMKDLGITPKLRSYGPALSSFCNSGDVEKAFEVEAYMLENGVKPQEPELETLLRASVIAQRGDKVYYLLHKFRTTVRQVSPSAAELFEAWFRCPTAPKVGRRKWDVGVVAKVIEDNGGGWHGLGWLGRGKWTTSRSNIDRNGFCLACGEKLAIIDLDPEETEDFAARLAKIATKGEKNLNFQNFQKWLEKHGSFEAVIDAANVGLSSHGHISLRKVNVVAHAMREMIPSRKWPLIVLHNEHLTGERMKKPWYQKLVKKWKQANCIYATPTGSNDDWYSLFAAIKCKCLIITNDEMRDHTYQILEEDFFPKWKERHQVRFTFENGSVTFQMPPPYSVVIQESEKGHWHIPVSKEDLLERERTWLCVTRHSSQTQ